jgi:hypothetical protein
MDVPIEESYNSGLSTMRWFSLRKSVDGPISILPNPPHKADDVRFGRPVVIARSHPSPPGAVHQLDPRGPALIRQARNGAPHTDHDVHGPTPDDRALWTRPAAVTDPRRGACGRRRTVSCRCCPGAPSSAPPYRPGPTRPTTADCPPTSDDSPLWVVGWPMRSRTPQCISFNIVVALGNWSFDYRPINGTHWTG